jgi:hypothetical protein
MSQQRLIVYIFAHLVHCTPDQRYVAKPHFNNLADVSASLLAEFESILQRWMTWDVIAMIQNHQQVKDALWDFFQRGLLVRY